MTRYSLELIVNNKPLVIIEGRKGVGVGVGGECFSRPRRRRLYKFPNMECRPVRARVRAQPIYSHLPLLRHRLNSDHRSAQSIAYVLRKHSVILVRLLRRQAAADPFLSLYIPSL